MNPDLLDTLPPEFLGALLARLVRSRASLPEPERGRLQRTTRDFVAGHGFALEAVVQRTSWAESHPALAADLFHRALQLANGRSDRLRVEELAAQAPAKELLHARHRPELFTRSQQAVLTELEAIARVFFRGEAGGPLRLRWTTIILGPTGVGKSHLVRAVGDRLRVDTLRFGATNWVPSGARVDPHSLKIVLEAVRRGRPFILHIEEVDKFLCRGGDPWTQAQLTEFLLLLDGALGSPWTGPDREALQRLALIVGTGAWQELSGSSGPGVVGFSAQCQNGGGSDLLKKIRQEQKIPAELLARFGHTLILDPLDAAEFRKLAQQLGLGAEDYDAEEAVRSGQNVRYLEASLAQRELRRERVTMRGAWVGSDRPHL